MNLTRDSDTSSVTNVYQESSTAFGSLMTSSAVKAGGAASPRLAQRMSSDRLSALGGSGATTPDRATGSSAAAAKERSMSMTDALKSGFKDSLKKFKDPLGLLL